MKLIVRGRRMGKTTELIKMSAKTGAYIVCPTHADAYRIAKQAEEMGLKIPFPVDNGEFKRGLPGLGRNLLIDDADRLFRMWTYEKIDAITMTDEGEEF